MVIGHTVQPMDVILLRIQLKSQILPLDNGCYYGFFYKNEPHLCDLSNIGNLCTLNLDTLELIVQSNID